jgi:hypothetical protein
MQEQNSSRSGRRVVRRVNHHSSHHCRLALHFEKKKIWIKGRNAAFLF